jgi:hypothetical protein
MTIRQRVKVLPGGTIEIHDPELPDGAEAEVIVLVAPPMDDDRPLVSFLGQGKGCFADAAEVDAFLRAERESWDR